MSLQSPKPGVSPRRTIGNNSKQGTSLLKDNSWIKREIEENDTEDVLQDSSQLNPVSPKTSVSSLTKRFSETPQQPNKSSISTTPKSSGPTATSPGVPTVPKKPPIAAKNPALTSASKCFTDRVFSGANSSDKVFTPVKKSVGENPEVSNEPLKTVMSSEDSAALPPEPPTNYITPLITKRETVSSKPPSTTITSTRQTTINFTNPEETWPSPVSERETYSQSWEQRPSNGKAAVKTTTATTFNSASDNGKDASSSLDSFADILSSSTSYISQRSSPPNTLSYKSSQSVYDIGTTVKETPTVSSMVHSPAAPPSLSRATTSRIAGKRDLCSFCAKSIVGGDRMILEELDIVSHTSCFKCEVCLHTLGALEAGDHLWVYKEMVYCANCYKRTKEQWFR